MVKKLFIDVIGLTGLALLGYGLYIKTPWIAFSVVGALLIVFAVMITKE